VTGAELSTNADGVLTGVGAVELVWAAAEVAGAVLGGAAETDGGAAAETDGGAAETDGGAAEIDGGVDARADGASTGEPAGMLRPAVLDVGCALPCVGPQPASAIAIQAASAATAEPVRRAGPADGNTRSG
jgi:hypothetical protein